jgi:carbamoyltransferase
MEIAIRLSRGEVVAHYGGRMEYGPRALGHRSILAACVDVRMNARLNQALSRSDFMPFAPILLSDDIEDWVDGIQPLRESARYMTTTVYARPALTRLCPAVVHADGTLRPQVVQPGDLLYPILSAYRARTGIPALLNTSFNLHEEPIVRTPSEAISTWKAARLDALVLGPYLVQA